MAVVNGLRVEVADKRFDGRGPVLQGLHLSAGPGEFLALVGPSGAGKSTLLSLLAGLDQAFEGDLSWNGRPLYAPGESPRNLGILFQQPRLMPWLSALDNVSLVLADSRNKRDRAMQLLADVGLSGWETAWPEQLSGGMQRRVALARAFAVQPRLLLMDEPFISLDMPTANHLRFELLALWQRQRPLVVYVTHDLREALAMADRVLFLSARPARVLWDEPVNLARPRQIEGPEVAARQAELLSAHPDLLSGMLSEGPGRQPGDNA